MKSKTLTRKKIQKITILIKKSRINTGLTQKRLCEQTGIAKWTYSRRENGISKFKLSEILSIISILRQHSQHTICDNIIRIMDIKCRQKK